MKTIFTTLAFSASLMLIATESKAAEFFIKINRTGQHTVLVSDQYQTNSTNVYRFFDLPAGSTPVKISDANTGVLLFDGNINIGSDERVVAELTPAGSVSIIGTFTVTYSNWYTQNGQNTAANNNTNNNQVVPPPPPPPPAPIGVAPEKFSEIISAIKAQTVESYKLDKAKSIAKKNMFSARQVADICNLFKVESYKLDFAKFAYDYTVDKDNYFVVGKTFRVASYSRELDAYVDKK